MLRLATLSLKGEGFITGPQLTAHTVAASLPETGEAK